MKELSLRNGVVGSLGIHLGLLLFFVAKQMVWPSALVPYVPTLKVDLVDLPDLTKQEMERIRQGPQAPTKKNAAPSPADLILDKRNQRKEKIQGALDRIKALQQVESDIEAPEKIKGNQISKGTSLSGEAREKAEPSYYDTVLDRIRSHWALPVWVARQSLSAQVLIRIGSNGAVESLQFVRRSGNAAFDDAVGAAIRQAQPFPAPPSAVQGSVAQNGILLGFPL